MSYLHNVYTIQNTTHFKSFAVTVNDVIFSDEDLKNKSKTFNFSINMFSVLNLLAIATLCFFNKHS